MADKRFLWAEAADLLADTERTIGQHSQQRRWTLHRAECGESSRAFFS